jgi:hypothetical protein
MTLRRLAPVLLVVGVVLMVGFEDVVTRVLGMLCLIGFVATGVWMIASPELLAREEE